LSTPFKEFVANVTAVYGVNCGDFSYTVTAFKITPLSPGVLKSMSINKTNSTVDIELDTSKIGEDGLTSEFILEGKLAIYPPFKTEPFTVKVYTFECSAKPLTNHI
jgi:hypothetical protein